jgi:hypothetical protein
MRRKLQRHEFLAGGGADRGGLVEQGGGGGVGRHGRWSWAFAWR